MGSSVFPSLDGLEWGVKKTPQFFGKVMRSVSGVEVRASFSSDPLYNFSIPFEFLRQYASYTDLATLMGFFMARKGSWDSFLYSDPSDYSVTDQSIGTGDNSDTTFQLVRTLGGNTENVCNVHALTNIKVDGSVTSAYTASATGLITFTSPPANGKTITWTGTYYHRCRFTEDELEFENIMSGLWKSESVDFVGCLGTKIL
jgi:uncharacterized protein (TIGR02217 family)